MSLIPCRDCGTPLAPGVRGCPRCARNLVAERAVGRWLLLLAASVAVIVLALLVWLCAR